MNSRLATRYFIVFGGITALSLVMAAVLLTFSGRADSERERLALFRQAADSLAATADAVLHGREEPDALRTALSFAEASLRAQVFAAADFDAPFMPLSSEPLLRGVKEELDGLSQFLHIKDYSYQGTPYSLYAVPLSNSEGVVVIAFPMSGVLDSEREAAFLTALCVCGIALFALLCAGFAASRAARPILALKRAAERLKAGEDADDIAARQANELGSLLSVFNSMKAAFQNELRARDDFTANISHDLRTPLTSISGFTQAMLDGVIKPQEYRKTHEIILREVKNMIRLTGDILEIAKIDSGRLKLNKEYVDLSELLQETLEGLAGSYPDVRRSFFARDDVGVMADRGRLMQVFTNLIVNALKYNKPGGEVSIQLARKAKSAEVQITDTGVGIAEEDVARIFEKFYRADKSRNAAKEGTGIGLYVVKRLLEMHGASIAYSSTPGEGTCVRVEIPL